MNLLALTRRLNKLIDDRDSAGDACQVIIYDGGMMRPGKQGNYTPQPEAGGLDAAFTAWGMKPPKTVLYLPDNGRGPVSLRVTHAHEGIE